MIARRFLDSPPILCIEVTDRCNMACPMCITRSHRGKRSGLLSLEEIKTGLLLPFGFAGGRQVVITGGEPTLAEDLPEILECCVRLRLKVFLATNLYRAPLPVMRRILELLSDAKHTVMISYDSVNPDEMKAIRGVDAHGDVTANLLSLLEVKENIGAETKLCASLVLQRENAGSVADTLEYLSSFRLHKIFVQPINMYGEIDRNNFHLARAPYEDEALPDIFRAIDTTFRLAEKESRIWISQPDIRRWKKHFTRPAENHGRCASNAFIFVDPFGNYRGCHNSKVYANIRDVGVVDFQSSRFYEEHIRLISKCAICLHSSS